MLPGWDIIPNYAYVDARVSKDALSRREPSTQFLTPSGQSLDNLFLQDGPFKGLGAGVGMYAQGKRNGYSNVPIRTIVRLRSNSWVCPHGRCGVLS